MGVPRNAALHLELNERVERIAGRLAADAIPNRIAFEPHRQREREDFRDALNRKALLRIADGEEPVVDGAQRHAEAIDRYVRKRRDIGRTAAAADERPHFTVNFAEDLAVLQAARFYSFGGSPESSFAA